MRLPAIPLAARLPLVSAALLGLVGLVASQAVMGALVEMQNRHLRETLTARIDALALALGPAVLREDVWETFDILDRASGAGGRLPTLRSTVADRGGTVIASSHPDMDPVGAPLAPAIDGAMPVADLSVSGDVTAVSVVAPLMYQGQHVGTLVSRVDLSALLAERRATRATLLAGNAAAILLLGGIGYALVRRGLRPVAVLSTHLSGTGDDPHPVPERAFPDDPELARLFATYNRMVDAVRDRAETDRRIAERERYVSLGRLSSSLAHEINNPLGGLMNAVDTLRRYQDRPEAAGPAIDLLDRGLRHLRDVTRAALQTHRGEHGAAPLTAADFDDLRLLIEPEIGRREQRLDWRVGELPDLGCGLPAGPVRQIALNLLLNASEGAGACGTVCFAAGADAGALRLCVCDTGAGLPASAVARLLRDAPPVNGGGFGLRLVRDLAAGLSGEIDHARRDGRTEIRIVLPLREPA